MTEDLLDDPDMYAELNQHRRGCVSSVMHTGVPDAGQRKQPMSGRPPSGALRPHP